MKSRVRKVANFLAFNLLFFALYLNFIHKDRQSVVVPSSSTQAAAFSGTVLVQNPEKYLEQHNNTAVTEVSVPEAKATIAKRSIN